MEITIPLVWAVAPVVWFLVKTQRVRVWHLVPVLLLGYLLYTTFLGPVIGGTAEKTADIVTSTTTD